MYADLLAWPSSRDYTSIRIASRGPSLSKLGIFKLGMVDSLLQSAQQYNPQHGKRREQLDLIDGFIGKLNLIIGAGIVFVTKDTGSSKEGFGIEVVAIGENLV
ncbi:hypothetical protein NE237_012322 [Protea cynaroides]|uniref:Uncharacterized protein n=1 Tax=Protea cynaroides TaxID=273540 RepID=A0A9Q0H1L7_9MAGN|nr:hypothetical protein NE237_012322 [Protea cynaroides]